VWLDSASHLADDVAVALGGPLLAHWPTTQVPRISNADWWVGLTEAALPQFPVTLLNAVVSTARLAEDLYPPRDRVDPSTGAVLVAGDPRTPVPVEKISASIGVMNLVGCWFGHFPSCHGCGGLAGQHLFGSRSGSSMAAVGLAKVALAVVLGPALLPLLTAFPRPVLGVLLAVSGLELASSARDVDGKDSAAVMLVGAGFVLKVGTAAGFSVSWATAVGLEWRRRSLQLRTPGNVG